MENKKTSGLGIAGLILGIIGLMLSIIVIGIIPCIIGLVLSIVALTQKDRKHGTAIGGIVCSVIGIGVFVLFLSLLSTDEESTVTNSTNEVIDVKTEEKDLASQMEITEYVYKDDYGTTLYFLEILNTSDETVEINVNSIAKDSNGNTIGATDSYEVGVAPGEEVLLENYFYECENAESFEYTMTVDKDKSFTSVKNDVSVEESRTDEKVIITCTNNGDEPAEFVKAYALFFKNGEVSGYDFTYITDDDSELKPGAKLSSELNAYDGYDDVKVFVHGRR